MKKRDLNKIINNPKITHCYLWKGSYYRPNSCGYTNVMVKAGIYTKELALRHHENCNSLVLVPINKIEHNNLIMNEITELLTRYIHG